MEVNWTLAIAAAVCRFHSMTDVITVPGSSSVRFPSAGMCLHTGGHILSRHAHIRTEKYYAHSDPENVTYCDYEVRILTPLKRLIERGWFVPPVRSVT
jgi:hypothetical protein